MFHQLSTHILGHDDIKLLNGGQDGFFEYSWALGLACYYMLVTGEQAWAPVRLDLDGRMFLVNAFR